MNSTELNPTELANNAAANLARNWARFGDLPKIHEVIRTSTGMVESDDGTAAVRADYAVFVKNMTGSWTRCGHSAIGAIGK